MNLGRTGIWSGELRRHADTGAIADAAAELEGLGYSALFIPGGTGGDVLEASARLLDATRSVSVATGILNVWMHEAGEVATARAELEQAHPGRFVLGLGVSHGPQLDAIQPGLYRKPLSKMRSYLDELDDGAGPPVPAERRVLAALGPKMLELSRERAVGAHPYFVPVDHTRAAREILGPDALLAPEQAVLLETDPGKARERARDHLSFYLRLPNYSGNLLRYGFTEDDVRDGGSDRLLDAIVAWGDEEAIAERVQAHRDAGADHVCIQVVGGPKGELPREDWRRLAEALIV